MTKVPGAVLWDNLCLQHTVQQGGAASYFRLKDTVRCCIEHETRDDNFNARKEDRSLQGAAGWKGNPRGNPEGVMRRKRSKIANMEIIINGLRKDNVCEEIRAASSTMETQQRRRFSCACVKKKLSSRLMSWPTDIPAPLLR